MTRTLPRNCPHGIDWRDTCPLCEWADSFQPEADCDCEDCTALTEQQNPLSAAIGILIGLAVSSALWIFLFCAYELGQKWHGQ